MDLYVCPHASRKGEVKCFAGYAIYHPYLAHVCVLNTIVQDVTSYCLRGSRFYQCRGQQAMTVLSKHFKLYLVSDLLVRVLMFY